MIINISPYAFTGIEIVNGSPKPAAGPGLLPFSVLSTVFSLLAIIILFRKLVRADGIEKVQLRFVTLGMALMLGLVIFTVLIPVALFNVNFFVSFIPFYTLIFLSLVAYTIIQHRFLEIRLAIARTLSFSFLVGSFLLIYSTLLIFAVPYLADILSIQASIIAAAGALFAVLLARYVQEILRRLTDRLLYQKQADYRSALVKASNDLSSTINIEDVTKIVIETMKNILRCKKTIILLQESTDTGFLPQASAGVRNFHVIIPHDHVILKHLRHSTGPLIKDELVIQKEQERSSEHIQALEEVQNALNWLDASVVLPLFVNKKLTGIIVLGDKLSGEPYLQDDVNFLAAFAAQSATALENARLYQESLEFGQKLQREVERATHELAVANEQLRDLDKAKSEFLSIASHQLYTPLTALRGYLSMIQEGDFGKTPIKQKPIVNILEKSASRLINLIRNLLDISRIESGRLELNLESVDLVTMTRELVQDLMPNALKKKLKLEFMPPTTKVAHVVVDRQRIRQVLLNFLDNAIKYTEQGHININLRQKGHDLIFSITDTGEGLSQTDIASLFNKFTRVGGTARLRTEGTGLGLYFARQIAKEHHGDVDASSPGPGQGSTFSLRLPIAGSPDSLKVGERTTVAIQAAEAHASLPQKQN